MTPYFWLGREAEQYRKLVRLSGGGPNYPDPPYRSRAEYDNGDIEDDAE